MEPSHTESSVGQTAVGSIQSCQVELKARRGRLQCFQSALSQWEILKWCGATAGLLVACKELAAWTNLPVLLFSGKQMERRKKVSPSNYLWSPRWLPPQPTPPLATDWLKAVCHAAPPLLPIGGKGWSCMTESPQDQSVVRDAVIWWTALVANQ